MASPWLPEGEGLEGAQRRGSKRGPVLGEVHVTVRSEKEQGPCLRQVKELIQLKEEPWSSFGSLTSHL